MSGAAADRPARGDAAMRRHIRRWRYVTGQLQVLLNSGAGQGAVAQEAHSLHHQCQQLAEAMRRVAFAPGAAIRRPPASTQQPNQGEST